MMKRSRTYFAIPPGDTIREQLEYRGISQKELSVRMCTSEDSIRKLIEGEVPLTPDTAAKLEAILEVPARFWLGLEAIYRDKLIKVQEENEADFEIRREKRSLLQSFKHLSGRIIKTVRI